MQAQNDPKRNDERKDPNEPGMGDPQFIRKREYQRDRDCEENGGWACGWHAIDWDKYDRAWDYDRIHDTYYLDEDPWFWYEDPWYEDDPWYD